MSDLLTFIAIISLLVVFWNHLRAYKGRGHAFLVSESLSPNIVPSSKQVPHKNRIKKEDRVGKKEVNGGGYRSTSSGAMKSPSTRSAEAASCVRVCTRLMPTAPSRSAQQGDGLNMGELTRVCGKIRRRRRDARIQAELSYLILACNPYNITL